jgi:hypothetical protein
LQKLITDFFVAMIDTSCHNVLSHSDCTVTIKTSFRIAFVIKQKIFRALQNDEMDATPGRFLDATKEWRPHFDLGVSCILISLLKDLYTI